MQMNDVKKDSPSYPGIAAYPLVVQEWWRTEPNYLIEYTENAEEADLCAIYFSSHDIYFPDTEEMFRRRIVEKNVFEWYRCRVRGARKHIFVRDVFKQWYLSGVNADICSQQKLEDFLREQTAGYRVVTIGSSAGGYGAARFGQSLHAEKVICFNAQFSLQKYVDDSTEQRYPLLNSILRDSPNGGGNILIPNDTPPIFYIFSTRSAEDVEQSALAVGFPNVRCIRFNSRKHGIPFLKVALPDFINQTTAELTRMAESEHNPIFFTIRSVGLRRTVTGFVSQLYGLYRKRHQ